MRIIVRAITYMCLIGVVKSASFENSGFIENFQEINKEIEFNNSCSCVMYYNCGDSNYIEKHGRNILDNRFGGIIYCKSAKYADGHVVCCKEKIKEKIKLSTNASWIIEEDHVSEWNNTQCGISRSCLTSVRIFTEETTPLNGEFPWLAAIYKREPNSKEWIHNKLGSLIHPTVVLTAAHVVQNLDAINLKVIVNGQIALSKIGGNIDQERNVKELITHPKFSTNHFRYNIALLVLDKPYDINNNIYINTICLKPESTFQNKRCLVAGWGATINLSEGSSVLNKVELPAHSPSRCEEMLQKTRLGSSFRFHESYMCAGGEKNKDACIGDGGAPLVCFSEDNSTMYQAGIVSFGIGCGTKNVPGVYTNVPYLYNWIVKHLKDRNIDV